MKASAPISPRDFSPSKVGYRKYIVALGHTKELADNIVMGWEAAGIYFIESYKEFLRLHETKEGKLDGMYKELEAKNEKWLAMIQSGHDDNDLHDDAYHMKMNIRNLVHRIEEHEKV